MKYILISTIPVLIAANLFAQPSFTLITDETNPINDISSTVIYRGASWVDIDNDNDIDLFATPYLFRNDGDGNFSKIELDGEEDFSGPGGSTWADYDNDGDIDCFISAAESGLFLNDGTGGFEIDVLVFTEPSVYTGFGCSFSDINDDGKIDLAIANPAAYTGSETPSFLFRQAESGKMEKITGNRFTDSIDYWTVPYFFKFDGDDLPDLFVSNGPAGAYGFGVGGPDYYFINYLDTDPEHVDPNYEEFTTPTLGTDIQDGQTYNFIDFNNDQFFDIYVNNWYGAPCRLYKGAGFASEIEEVVTSFSYNQTNTGSSWGDYDNDGDIDLITTSALNFFTNAYHQNNGDGTFTEIVGVFPEISVSGSVTNGDYDNDGDLDIFFMGDSEGLGLYANTITNENNWINITCKGDTINGSAIGTIVKVKAIINGTEVWQSREINAQSTYLGQNDLRVHFGLGDATEILELVIYYSDKSVFNAPNITANQFYCHTEGDANLEVCSVPDAINETIAENIIIYPNPVEGILYMSNLPGDELSLSIANTEGKIVQRLTKPSGIHTAQFNMNNFSPGVYILSVSSTNGIYKFKFLKL